MRRDSDGLQIPVRVDKDHPLIGQYVIEVTNQVSADDASRITRSMNEMVFQREGEQTRFCRCTICVDKKKDKYIVLRKLLVGDQEEFISNNPLFTGGEDDKSDKTEFDKEVVPSGSIQTDTSQ